MLYILYKVLFSLFILIYTSTLLLERYKSSNVYNLVNIPFFA